MIGDLDEDQTKEEEEERRPWWQTEMRGDESKRTTQDPGAKIRWTFRSPQTEQEGKDKGSEIDRVGVAGNDGEHTDHAAMYVDMEMRKKKKIRTSKGKARIANKIDKPG